MNPINPRLSDGAKQMRRHITRRLPVVAALGALLIGAACVDNEAVLPPVTPQPGGELFENYVALGNSITAGMQSGGINDSTQMESYAVMLAEQAGAEFGVPLFQFPGCPPPFATPFGPQRIGGLPDDFCALRTTPAPRRLNNLAVPGAFMASLFDSSVEATPLTTLILGGRTQIGAMQEADPTLVSVWIGNNGVLRGAVSGVLDLLTTLDSFQADAAALSEAINTTRARDAVIIGTVDPVAAAPILQPGAYFWALYQADPTAFGGKAVNDNCAPIDFATGQPNPLGAHMVSFRIVADPNFPEINCSGDAYPQGDPRHSVHVLTLEEQHIVRSRAAQFNAVLEGIANANGWIYLDPAAVFLPALMDGPPFNKIRKCQALQMLPPGATMEQFQEAVVQSCPVPPQMGGAPNFLGSWISFDGVHPARPAHEAVTNAIIAELNAKHGLSIPAR